MKRETKEESIYLKTDSRNRVSLTKLSPEKTPIYKAFKQGKTIILEPIQEMSEEEAWFFRPENKEILEHVKESLKQKGKHNLGSFKKYLKK